MGPIQIRGAGGADRRRAAALAEWEARYRHVLRVSGGGGDNGRNDPGGDGGNSGTNQRRGAGAGDADGGYRWRAAAGPGYGADVPGRAHGAGGLLRPLRDRFDRRRGRGCTGGDPAGVSDIPGRSGGLSGRRSAPGASGGDRGGVGADGLSADRIAVAKWQ